MTRWFQYQTARDENWRICTICKEYKQWNKYARTTATTTKRTPNCKECRNRIKKEYRKKTNNEKDREYKNINRKLLIWTIIIFPKENIKDIISWYSNQKRKVTEYVYKKWYKVESMITGYTRRVNTSLAIIKIICSKK